MTSQPQTKPEKNPLNVAQEVQKADKKDLEKILCPHCLRTATNGLKCKGICVADDDY